MTNTTANLVHEADAQRHHVRVKLPALVEINGTRFETRDWSTAGASVALPSAHSDASAFNEGRMHDALMIFNFNGFTLSVPMKVEVLHTKAEEGTNYVGLRYIDMTQDQIVIMRQLVSSYVTGELSSVGELIHVVSRNNFTKPRQLPKREDLTAGERFSGFLRKAAVPLVSLLLLAYVALSIFEHQFVIAAQKAVVTGDGVPVVAPGGGVVSFKELFGGDQVKKGDVLMTVLSDTGTLVGIDSPCDCIVEERLVNSGTAVDKGDVVLRLIPMENPLYVEARVSYEDAIRISKGQKAVLDIPGTTQDITGLVSGISIDAQTDASARVTIRPTQKLPVSMAGLPIRVRINTILKTGE
ncbi:MAG: HlyD family efflux transporter periplasmic adaptor subunit [Alphaproteobacteria bacterium]|nr:HlyD family efflux transporter periplasmic adaptor subunit [Alphaproteobacteria bacterium]